ncbi:MAG: TIGR02757 family protein [Rikenellaceae bacterium]|nr:TIGR02757 family protein [Rikenellaceae bacterium]
MDKEEIKDLLERLHDKYNRPEFIEHDPISVPHRFTSKEDIEIAGFLAATIAWGNRKAIVKNAHRMLDLMDESPYDFVVNCTESDLDRLTVFVHRTFNGDDFKCFAISLKYIYKNHGGIGGYFEKKYSEHGNIPEILSEFRKIFFEPEHPKRVGRHLSSIDKGSACKRLNMYIRWMVRRDDRGVDFGLWNKIPMSAIYLPLDIHAGNMSRALGLLKRKQNDWKAVDEVTRNLRTFDPEDPVKYDFSLFGAGIDGFLS